MSAQKPVLDWHHSDDNHGVLEADIDGAYPMEVEPEADEGTVHWQVWHPSSGDATDYTNGGAETVEQAQCAAEAFALDHARKIVARLERAK